MSSVASAVNPVDLNLYKEDFERFSQELGDSFRRLGFGAINYRGVLDEPLAHFLEDYKNFFALTTETKMKYKIENGGGQRGYTPFGIETAKGAEHHDLKEFWHIGRELPEGHKYRPYMPENIWPSEIHAIRERSLDMFAAFDALGAKLLEAIAYYLKLPRDFFVSAVNEGNSILRVLHYPPVEGDVPNVRAGAHEDINVITLLLGAEEAGLQVRSPSGEWLPITPPPGCLVINVGDMLQRLTNHVLPSTSHRVINPDPSRARFPRYSMPYFLHFNPDYEIRTLEGCITPDNPNRYPQPITADGYLQQRLHEIKLT